jgi:Spy/CpxP family protein refolding chaperone
MLINANLFAQDGPPPPRDDDRPPPQGQPPRPEEERAQILQQLNLSPEQFRTIRRLLAENGPRARDAQRAFRDAQDSLDDVIYQDSVDDKAVQNAIKTVNDAQAKLVNVRMENELAIRRVLTPEQLVTFRSLRKEQMLRKMLQERIKNERQDGNKPNRRPLRDRLRQQNGPPPAQNDPGPQKPKAKPSQL